MVLQTGIEPVRFLRQGIFLLLYVAIALIKDLHLTWIRTKVSPLKLCFKPTDEAFYKLIKLISA